MAHDAQIVRDKHKGQPHLGLNVLQQVDDLGLHGDIEGGNRFVGDDKFRLNGQGAGDADALPLAAGKLVRVAAGGIGGQADHL